MCKRVALQKKATISSLVGGRQSLLEALLSVLNSTLNQAGWCFPINSLAMTLLSEKVKYETSTLYSAAGIEEE